MILKNVIDFAFDSTDFNTFYGKWYVFHEKRIKLEFASIINP